MNIPSSVDTTQGVKYNIQNAIFHNYKSYKVVHKHYNNYNNQDATLNVSIVNY